MDLLLKPTTAPHLVIGVPSQSGSDDAVAAFARKTRRVKSDPTSPFSIEDLTAALAEIQHGERERAVVLEYTIPCNPDVYQTAVSFNVDGQSFGASDVPVDLIDASKRAVRSSEVGLTLLAAAIRSLFEWDWQSAGDLARECLRVSDDEDLRDEALNVLAAGLAMTNQPERAMQALQKDVEGKWNLNLQANLALVATSQDPLLAAAQMSFLIDGVSSAAEKLQATRMAIGLWRSSHSEGVDEEDQSPIPPELMHSIYRTLGHPDLFEEEFFDIALFVAEVDSHGQRLEQALLDSPHRHSLSAQVVQARAEGFSEYIDRLITCSSQDHSHERPWIQERADGVVRTATNGLLDDENREFWMGLAFTILKNGLDCSNFYRIGLRFLLLNNIHTVIEEDSRPGIELFNWHTEAGLAINELDLTEEQRELLVGLQGESGTKLALLVHRALITQLGSVENAARQIRTRMSGLINRLTADKASVRSISRSIIAVCSDAIDDYNRSIPLVTRADFRDQMNDVRVAYQTVKRQMLQYT